jgi:hypothetical protein
MKKVMLIAILLSFLCVPVVVNAQCVSVNVGRPKAACATVAMPVAVVQVSQPRVVYVQQPQVIQVIQPQPIIQVIQPAAPAVISVAQPAVAVSACATASSGGCAGLLSNLHQRKADRAAAKSDFHQARADHLSASRGASVVYVQQTAAPAVVMPAQLPQVK